MSFFHQVTSYSPDDDGFLMPYKTFGTFDRQLMFEKYKRLTNKPNTILEIRYGSYAEG